VQRGARILRSKIEILFLFELRGNSCAMNPSRPSRPSREMILSRAQRYRTAANSRISSEDSFKSTARAVSSTCCALRPPTIAAVTAELASVHAMATSPGV
jgi:hypothetical protein